MVNWYITRTKIGKGAKNLCSRSCVTFPLLKVDWLINEVLYNNAKNWLHFFSLTRRVEVPWRRHGIGTHGNWNKDSALFPQYWLKPEFCSHGFPWFLHGNENGTKKHIVIPCFFYCMKWRSVSTLLPHFFWPADPIQKDGKSMVNSTITWPLVVKV